MVGFRAAVLVTCTTQDRQAPANPDTRVRTHSQGTPCEKGMGERTIPHPRPPQAELTHLDASRGTTPPLLRVSFNGTIRVSRRVP